MLIETNVFDINAPMTIIAGKDDWKRIHAALDKSDDGSLAELRSMIAAKLFHTTGTTARTGLAL